ncbi:unnamed protein product [Prorocentrum cordatum]|uniref:Subtilisin n=1 Tax=Prorocentrum cordatum TaxID=2364126 RepID=A0ABN9YKV4_9DINO|nr:unnamed protein product [Polarella glacialis]
MVATVEGTKSSEGSPTRTGATYGSGVQGTIFRNELGKRSNTVAWDLGSSTVSWKTASGGSRNGAWEMQKIVGDTIGIGFSGLVSLTCGLTSERRKGTSSVRGSGGHSTR